MSACAKNIEVQMSACAKNIEVRVSESGEGIEVDGRPNATAKIGPKSRLGVTFADASDRLLGGK